jgi:hypothetical protein
MIALGNAYLLLRGSAIFALYKAPGRPAVRAILV